MNQTNSEMPISSFTLNELITMAGGEKRPGIMGECIAANSASEMEIFRFPSRLNALIIGVGTEGETSLTSNLQEFRLKKDSLFIFSPKHILQVQSNNRFTAHLIVIAPDFLKRINIDTKRMMPLFLQFGSLPCMELTQAESQSLRSFISMVEQELKGSETDFSSEIIGVQEISAGERVGYGGTFVADGPARVGVVACGYADGYPRHADTGTPVLVGGVRTRTVGRVSMDMITVDLTPVPDAGPGAEVTLWGRAGNGALLPIGEVVQAAGTVGYGLMCALAPRVPVTMD